LLDLTDVYMDVYLPTDDAGRLRFGAEARLILDAAPQYVIPATVNFIASEAQFTPKYVETKSEREKLTFRVKLQIPAEVLSKYQDVVKTGVPGTAIVRVSPEAEWPSTLVVKLP
jgi:HlyD family secretion protein